MVDRPRLFRELPAREWERIRPDVERAMLGLEPRRICTCTWGEDDLCSACVDRLETDPDDRVAVVRAWPWWAGVIVGAIVGAIAGFTLARGRVR